MTVTHTQAHTHTKKKEYIYIYISAYSISNIQSCSALAPSSCLFALSHSHWPFFLFSSPVIMPLRKRQCPLSGKKKNEKKYVVDCSVAVLPLNDLS